MLKRSSEATQMQKEADSENGELNMAKETDQSVDDIIAEQDASELDAATSEKSKPAGGSASPVPLVRPKRTGLAKPARPTSAKSLAADTDRIAAEISTKHTFEKVGGMAATPKAHGMTAKEREQAEREVFEAATPEQRAQILKDREAREAVKNAEKRLDEIGCRFVDALTFKRNPPPPFDWIIKDMIAKGWKVTTTAKPKTKKTFNATGRAKCIAKGENWVGHIVPKPRHVVYFNLEVTERGMWERMEGIDRALDGAAAEGYFTLVNLRGKDPASIMRDHTADIITMLKHLEAEYVVIDPRFKLLVPGEDENSSAGLKAILDLRDAIIDQTGAAVEYVQHDPKGDSAGKAASDRGAGSYIGAADYDFGIFLDRHEDDACIVQSFDARERKTPPKETLRFDEETQTFALDADTPPTEKKIMRLGGVVVTSETKAGRARIQEERFRLAVQKFVAEHGIMSKSKFDTELSKIPDCAIPAADYNRLIKVLVADNVIACCSETKGERKSNGELLRVKCGKTFYGSPKGIAAYLAQFGA